MNPAPESPPDPRPGRSEPGDPSIRRTWWLLAGAFLVLALIAGLRLVTIQGPVDWLIAALVVVAAVAAIAHRNAVAGLEARGRGEAESFARILRGLSRSVSAESIVSAILDDLIDATAADHVVLVRHRPANRELEATLVSRRPGVPHTTATLPLSLLDTPAPTRKREVDRASGEPVAVGPGDVEAIGIETVGVPPTTQPVAVPGARRASDVGRGRTVVRRIAAESVALLRDLGLPLPDALSGRSAARESEVLARGPEVTVVERIAGRIQSSYGLAHMLTAPLRAEGRVIGAIILSRRDRRSWSESARRLVRGAAAETAAALARADSFREAAAGASTDPLTGLPNRRYFEEYSSLLAGRRRAGDAVAVLMIDIDKFKRLNDTYGHPIGDAVLRSVAGAITAAVRDHDVPARIGGEEFAVLLRNPGPSVALEVGERVRQAVRELDLLSLGVPSVPGVSVSVGVANASGPDEPIQAVVDRADRALLRAKRTGRDRVISG